METEPGEASGVAEEADELDNVGLGEGVVELVTDGLAPKEREAVGVGLGVPLGEGVPL
jgi:hypothetical protein